MSYFPLVPNAPGVPQVPRSNTIAYPATPVLGILQGAAFSALANRAIWGIFYAGTSTPTGVQAFTQAFKNNLLRNLPSWLPGAERRIPNQAVEADSCIYVGGNQDNVVSDFPVQSGAFASYNKVVRPQTPIVRLAKSGTSEQTQNFLQSIKTLADNTILLDVVTKGYTFRNCTIEGYRYSRSAESGVDLVQVDIRLVEIRQVTPSFSNASTSNSVNAQNPVNNGLQTPVELSGDQAKKVSENYLY